MRSVSEMLEPLSTVPPVGPDSYNYSLNFDSNLKLKSAGPIKCHKFLTRHFREWCLCSISRIESFQLSINGDSHNFSEATIPGRMDHESINDTSRILVLCC